MKRGWIAVALLAVLLECKLALAQYLVPAQSVEQMPEPLPQSPSYVPPDAAGPAGAIANQPPAPLSLPSDSPTAWEDIPPPPRVLNRFFFGADYLRWWMKKDQHRDLLFTTNGITNPATNFGALGQSATVREFGGDEFSTGHLNGVRVTLGYVPETFYPIELSGFWVETGKTYARNSGGGGFPLVARSIFQIQPPITPPEVVFVTSFPDFAAGGWAVDGNTNFYSAEFNFLPNLYNTLDTNARTVDLQFGPRFVLMNESLDVLQFTGAISPQTLVNFGGNSFTQPHTIFASDNFFTRNAFYGGQFGCRTSFSLWHVNVQLKGNIAVGYTEQVVNISGRSTIVGPSITQTQFGGIQAVASNFGRVQREKITFIPEFAFNLEYPLFNSFRLYVGYHFLYWSSVVRPGEQFDRVVDVRQVPTDAAFQPNFVGSRPGNFFRRSSLWLHGLNLGAAFTF
ncbi:MAG: hypothetical protein KatS3mg105_4317 [Gemmatales bacterium]|nr:MAG: hypothetical protein KatS3mg105_4317 [Gemmatales bacterium]